MREADWEDDDDDFDDEAGDATVPCPNCGGEVYDDAEQCPHCGQYITEEGRTSNKPWWVVAGVLVCLAVAVYWLFI